MPRCKNCKQKFTPRYFNQKYCMDSDACISAFAKYAKDQKWKQQKKQMKREIETIGDVSDKLQKEINLIARLIDKGHPCMMCNNPNMKRINGCHYHSRGANPTIRFHLLNIWHGCHSCNSEKGGNIPGYDLRLVETYGKQFWEYIKFDLVREYPRIDLTKDEIRQLTKQSRKIVRELKDADCQYSNEQRVELRKIINKRLNIYTKI